MHSGSILKFFLLALQTKDSSNSNVVKWGTSYFYLSTIHPITETSARLQGMREGCSLAAHPVCVSCRDHPFRRGCDAIHHPAPRAAPAPGRLPLSLRAWVHGLEQPHPVTIPQAALSSPVGLLCGQQDNSRPRGVLGASNDTGLTKSNAN